MSSTIYDLPDGAGDWKPDEDALYIGRLTGAEKDRRLALGELGTAVEVVNTSGGNATVDISTYRFGVDIVVNSLGVSSGGTLTLIHNPALDPKICVLNNTAYSITCEGKTIPSGGSLILRGEGWQVSVGTNGLGSPVIVPTNLSAGQGLGVSSNGVVGGIPTFYCSTSEELSRALLVNFPEKHIYMQDMIRIDATDDFLRGRNIVYTSHSLTIGFVQNVVLGPNGMLFVRGMNIMSQVRLAKFGGNPTDAFDGNYKIMVEELKIPSSLWLVKNIIYTAKSSTENAGTYHLCLLDYWHSDLPYYQASRPWIPLEYFPQGMSPPEFLEYEAMLRLDRINGSVQLKTNGLLKHNTSAFRELRFLYTGNLFNLEADKRFVGFSGMVDSSGLVPLIHLHGYLYYTGSVTTVVIYSDLSEVIPGPAPYAINVGGEVFL